MTGVMTCAIAMGHYKHNSHPRNDLSRSKATDIKLLPGGHTHKNPSRSTLDAIWPANRSSTFWAPPTAGLTTPPC